MKRLSVPSGLAIAIVLSSLLGGGGVGYWFGLSSGGQRQIDTGVVAPHVVSAPNNSVPRDQPAQIRTNPVEGHQERRRGNPAFAKLLEELTEVAKADPKKAFAETHNVTPESFGPLLRAALAKTLLKDDFSMVGEILMAVDNHPDRQSVLFEVLPVAIKRNQDQTLSAIRQQLTGLTLNSALRIAVQIQVGEGDVDGAIRTQLSMPFSHERDLAIANVASNVSAQGLDEALQWLAQLQDEGEQGRAKSSIQEFFIRKRDYPALERLLEITKDARKREALIHVIASQFESADAPAAQAFMNSLPVPERDFVLIQQIIKHPSATFEEKMEMAAKLSGLQARSDAFREVVRKEVHNNPSEAAAMALSLPDHIRIAGVSALVDHWTGIDSEAASVWVQQLPQGVLRESAITRLAISLKYKDRSAAREVASWLEDQQKREALIQRVEK